MKIEKQTERGRLSDTERRASERARERESSGLSAGRRWLRRVLIKRGLNCGGGTSLAAPSARRRRGRVAGRVRDGQRGHRMRHYGMEIEQEEEEHRT